MSVTVIPPPSRWVQLQQGLRRVTPFVLLAALVTVVWWAGAWLLPLALFAVACWRAPDPQHIRHAVELVACAVVLLLTATAVLIHCARGQVTKP